MRLIDADSLSEEWLENGENERIYNTDDFLDSLDHAPTIDAVPVVHGHWIEETRDEDWWVTTYFSCDNCDNAFGRKTNFCPHCGAKMRS